MKKLQNNGFTIVELMIATVVFSIVLLTISAAILQIGRLYYKSITSARTQEVARSLMDDITRSIQFNAGQIVGIGPNTTVPSQNYSNDLDSVSPTGYKAICIATKHYSFKFGQQQVGGAHSLVQNDIPSGCTSTKAQNLSSNPSGVELLSDHMRLSNLVVAPTTVTGTYKVTVRVIYGDNELLCSPTLNNCSSTVDMDDPQINAARDLSCKNIRSGSEFCAVSELSTIVKRRVSDE